MVFHNYTVLTMVTFAFMNTLMKYRMPPGEMCYFVALRNGLICDRERMNNSYNKYHENMIRNYPNFGAASGLTWQEWWKRLFTSVFNDLSPDVERKELNEIILTTVEEYKLPESWIMCEGVVDFLDFLYVRNITIGIVTNFDPRVRDVIHGYGLSKYFRFMMISYDVGMRKPNQDIFFLTEMEEGNPSKAYHRVMHIGNNPHNDYYGAMKYGFGAHLVGYDRDKDMGKLPNYVKREHVFRNLRELHRLYNDEIESLGGRWQPPRN